MIKIGLIMAQKTLIDCNKIKFKWPNNEKEMTQITKQQLEWLLSGLEIYTFEDIDITQNTIAS